MYKISETLICLVFICKIVFASPLIMRNSVIEDNKTDADLSTDIEDDINVNIVNKIFQKS